MITDLIITAFLAGLDAVFSLIPDFVLYENTEGIGVGAIVGNMNTVFPVLLVITLAAIAIGIRLLFNLFDLGMWVYHQFWGAS